MNDLPQYPDVIEMQYVVHMWPRGKRKPKLQRKSALSLVTEWERQLALAFLKHQYENRNKKRHSHISFRQDLGLISVDGVLNQELSNRTGYLCVRIAYVIKSHHSITSETSLIYVMDTKKHMPWKK